MTESGLFVTEWICDTLWEETGSGESGEEGLLLDSAGPLSEHPHLLRVEENGLRQQHHLLVTSVNYRSSSRSMKMAAERF